MRPRDTSAEAEAVQMAVFRRMTPSQRVEIAARMSEDIRELALVGIRRRHPDYDDATARWALFRMLYGDELFQRAWPRAPLVAP